MARFGAKFDAQGVLAGTQDSARCIGYLTKYLTKQLGDCHQPDTDAQREHTDRLADALRYEPCSPPCANWLRYGITPKTPGPAWSPASAKARLTASINSAMPGAGCWSPANGPARHWPTIAAIAKPGWPMLGLPAPDPAGYSWELVTPVTRTICRLPAAADVLADRAQWEMPH